MNYKEVRELADAGFPMPERSGNLLKNPDCNGCAEMFRGAHKANSNCLLIEPILEELIEACGEEFACLSPIRDHTREIISWVAQATSMIEDENFCTILECCPDSPVGPTPKEAVRRLWLALNPQK